MVQLAIALDLGTFIRCVGAAAPQQLFRSLPLNLEVLVLATSIHFLTTKIVDLFTQRQLFPTTLKRIILQTLGESDNVKSRVELEGKLAKQWEQLKQVWEPSGVEVVIGEPWLCSDEVVVGDYKWEILDIPRMGRDNGNICVY